MKRQKERKGFCSLIHQGLRSEFPHQRHRVSSKLLTRQIDACSPDKRHDIGRQQSPIERVLKLVKAEFYFRHSCLELTWLITETITWPTPEHHPAPRELCKESKFSRSQPKRRWMVDARARYKMNEGMCIWNKRLNALEGHWDSRDTTIVGNGSLDCTSLRYVCWTFHLQNCINLWIETVKQKQQAIAPSHAVQAAWIATQIRVGTCSHDLWSRNG